jgi:hypothetical protein
MEEIISSCINQSVEERHTYIRVLILAEKAVYFQGLGGLQTQAQPGYGLGPQA